MLVVSQVDSSRRSFREDWCELIDAVFCNLDRTILRFQHRTYCTVGQNNYT